MSLFSTLFSSAKKTNLTPNITPPSATQAPQYGALNQLASQRIQAGITGQDTPGVGFGNDYVNQATNPVAESMRRNFNLYTSPTIQNQYSGKGAGYSSMGASAQALGQGNVESDIGNLMAKFYTMNEAQKKNDITQGIGVGEDLNSTFLNQGNQQAAASERLANATAAQNNYAQSVDQQRAGQLMQAGAQALPAVGGGLTAIGTGMGGQIGGLVSQLGAGATGLGQSVGGQSGVKTGLLGQSDRDAIIKALFG